MQQTENCSENGMTTIGLNDEIKKMVTSGSTLVT
jgi:hypothetical protein